MGEQTPLTGNNAILTRAEVATQSTAFKNAMSGPNLPIYSNQSCLFNEDDNVYRQELDAFLKQPGLHHIKYFFGWQADAEHARHPLRLILFGVDAQNQLLFDSNAYILQKSWPPK